ncbi:MAG: 4Fe-4S binding protein [Tepidisphaeraceae bacterium]
MAVQVDTGKCDGCCTCDANCPTNAIKVENGKAVVNEPECIDCNTCIDACPQQAITTK